jgi:tRNA threonylcarbamoyladenosine biosynthesis protein TsaB
MNILAFDTTFEACSVCVARGRAGGFEVLASALEHFETGHAERLVPMIDEVMARAGVTFGELDRIAVTVGPGTFTGTRIGIAAARGLALATGIATAGVSSLAVMAGVVADALAACEAGADQLDASLAEAELAIAVDARRGEVYVQLFDIKGHEPKSPPRLLPIKDAALLSGKVPLLIAGSGAAAVAAAAARNGRVAVACLPRLLPDAKALARIAAGLAVTDAALQPLYLRVPDAKPQDGKSIARAEP